MTREVDPSVLRLLLEIEEVIDDATTERCLTGYDDYPELTTAGKKVMDLLRVALAKERQAGLQAAAQIVSSEESHQWRMDRGGEFGVRMPGAQIVAQRMKLVGQIINDRADKLDPNYKRSYNVF